MSRSAKRAKKVLRIGQNTCRYEDVMLQSEKSEIPVKGSSAIEIWIFGRQYGRYARQRLKQRDFYHRLFL